jgi:hypothetical protein
MNEIMGLVLLLLGGIMGGSFTTLMPFSRWQWESKWFLFSVLGYAIMPWLLVASTVDNLSEVYSHSKPSAVVECAMFGFLWGVGSQFFGIGVDALGNSLGFAIILGMTATLGG